MAAGRYYERKGDPFTLKVLRGDGPPTVRCWQRQSTGRQFFTRVLASDCYRLDARLIGEAVREDAGRVAAKYGQAVDAQQLAPLLAFDWHPQAGKVTVRRQVQPKMLKAEVRLAVTSTQTGSVGRYGVRYWLTCPRCSRRCGVLYASRWGHDGGRLAEPLTGCRECLGLTDESRQRHKTVDWAGAVQGARKFHPDRHGHYRNRSAVTHSRAHDVMMKAYGRIFKGLGIPMPGQE